MESKLLSVGVDVGTTTTQLILSSLTAVNCAGGFSVPRMQITDREILYRSAVHFTPLNGSLVDGDAIRALVEEEYRKAGISKGSVDTGAIIITGETSRKENAAAVLQALSGFAGDFVAATAGPDLESLLAAKGAGAVEASCSQALPILHMDIGGGTTNLALIRDGKILCTGCLNVGGRLLCQEKGRITYVSPVLSGITRLRPGDPFSKETAGDIVERLVSALEMAAGLTPPDGNLEHFLTKEASAPWIPPTEKVILSFSGGVAACIETVYPGDAFGDIGPLLGKKIKESRLCAGEYRLEKDAIRATVIGAGSHSVSLSGSTVFVADVKLPLKNLPAIVFEDCSTQTLTARIRQRLDQQDTEKVMLAFPRCGLMDHSRLTALAESIAAAKPAVNYVCTGSDIAKALGQKLRLLMPDTPCLCIDGIALTEGSFLDIGSPVGPALPVVIKTLILETVKS